MTLACHVPTPVKKKLVVMVVIKIIIIIGFVGMLEAWERKQGWCGVGATPVGAGKFHVSGGFQWAKNQNPDGSYLTDVWLEDTFNRYVDQVSTNFYQLRNSANANYNMSVAGMVCSLLLLLVGGVWKMGTCVGRRGAAGAADNQVAPLRPNFMGIL